MCARHRRVAPREESPRRRVATRAGGNSTPHEVAETLREPSAPQQGCKPDATPTPGKPNWVDKALRFAVAAFVREGVHLLVCWFIR
jgi:hypothetical protein